MIDTQAIGKQHVLRKNHIVIGVVRELGMQAIAGFSRAAMTDAVRQYDEVFVAVEKLSFIEQFAGESCAQESAARSSGPVQNQYRVSHDTRRVARRLSNRSVVDS